jgi:redox-sensitive bicupin YhaK (pirin superfamily)
VARSVLRRVASRKAQPAPGLIVDRPLPAPGVDMISPFLMIDHFGPTPVAAGSSGGLNPHPHRGFETVTLLFKGVMEHQDSAGHRGLIRPDGVQWMTAGSGVLHAEYHEAEFARRGGQLHGIQLWVNLPPQHKMTTPGYQDLSPGRLTCIDAAPGVRLWLIAGEAFGQQGPARTHSPMLVARACLQPGARLALPLPAGWNALAYCIQGGIQVGIQDAAFTTEAGEDGQGNASAPLPARHMVQFDDDGEGIVLRAVGDSATATDSDTQVLILAGAPVEGPVVSWGPFVMGSREEILQAQQDYLAGRMGRLGGVPF